MPRPASARLLVAALCLGLVTLNGCPPPEASQSKEGAAPAVAGPSAAERKEAETVFSQRCVACHGERGAGDGPASAGLDPKPRDFTDATWQSSVDDEYLEKIVKYGGTAVGRSPAMPGNPDLANKPGVIVGLRLHIRSLANKNP